MQFFPDRPAAAAGAEVEQHRAYPLASRGLSIVSSARAAMRRSASLSRMMLSRYSKTNGTISSAVVTGSGPGRAARSRRCWRPAAAAASLPARCRQDSPSTGSGGRRGRSHRRRSGRAARDSRAAAAARRPARLPARSRAAMAAVSRRLCTIARPARAPSRYRSRASCTSRASGRCRKPCLSGLSRQAAV